MATKWRDFEKLVSRIEELLSPQGAIITSPDRIKDKISNQEREVDASVRYAVGSVNILITIECRDRKAIPDDTWIEQLATKKQKIGASHTIAVSSTRFTKSAIKSADLYGIELRVIGSITDKDILSWLGRIRIINEIGKVCFEGIKIKVYDENEDLELAPDVLGEIKKEELQAMIFYIERNNQKASITSLLDYFAAIYDASKRGVRKKNKSNKVILKPGDTFEVELHPGLMSLFDDVPINANGFGRRGVFNFNILYGAALIETVKGPRYVKQVELKLVLAKEVQEIPISRKVQYKTPEEQISNVIESDIELFEYDKKKEIILSYSIPDDENGPVAMLVTEKKKN